MAGLLSKLGVVAVFADFVSQHLVGIDWFWASFIISATFVYSQYFFCQWYSSYYSVILCLCSYLGSDGRTNSIYHLALWFDGTALAVH